MKIIYQCEICRTNYSSAELAQKCEAQPYKPPLPTDTPVLHKGSVCRTGRECIHTNHAYSYLLSRKCSDNNWEGFNWAQGFTHEREFTVIIEEKQKNPTPAFTDACE